MKRQWCQVHQYWASETRHHEDRCGLSVRSGECTFAERDNAPTLPSDAELRELVEKSLRPYKDEPRKLKASQRLRSLGPALALAYLAQAETLSAAREALEDCMKLNGGGWAVGGPKALALLGQDGRKET